MDWYYGFTMAIRYFGNDLTAMSNRTGINLDRLNYLRNRSAKKIGWEEALIIDEETQGRVPWHQLVTKVDPRIRRRLEGRALPGGETSSLPACPAHTEKKPLSQKIFEAMEYEKRHCGHRQGQRTDLPLRENSHEVRGRTDSYLVKPFDLGSEWQYRQGKKVMQTGVFALIQAMDRGLPVYLAAVLAEHAPEEQERLFREKTPQEIKAYAQAMIDKKRIKNKNSAA